MYEKFIFDPKEVLILMRECAEFLAEKELLLDAYDGGDRRTLKETIFYLRKNKVIMNCMEWRAIRVANDCFWFSNQDYIVKATNKIAEVYNSLSKNKKKRYAEVYRKLKEQMSYKRIEHYLSFLYEDMAIAYSTSYGFDGGIIIVKKIYPYDSKGKEQTMARNQIKVNNEKKMKLQREIQWLGEENQRLKEKLKA